MGYIVWKHMSCYCANMNLWHSTYIIISIVANNHITIIMGGATIILLLHRAVMTLNKVICQRSHLRILFVRHPIVLWNTNCIDIMSHTMFYHIFPDFLMSTSHPTVKHSSKEGVVHVSQSLQRHSRVLWKRNARCRPG